MEKVVIRKPFDRFDFKPTPKSDGVEKQYRLTRDENMNCIYKEVGELNVAEYVESFSLGCSLRSILERCAIMPIYDKVRYLQQTTDGYSADLTNLPKDGTEAFVLLNKVREEHPDIYERFSKGESFDSIIESIIPFTENNVESEVATNGEN